MQFSPVFGQKTVDQDTISHECKVDLCVIGVFMKASKQHANCK